MLLRVSCALYYTILLTFVIQSLGTLMFTLAQEQDLLGRIAPTRGQDIYLKLGKDQYLAMDRALFLQEDLGHDRKLTLLP